MIDTISARRQIIAAREEAAKQRYRDSKKGVTDPKELKAIEKEYNEEKRIIREEGQQINSVFRKMVRNIENGMSTEMFYEALPVGVYDDLLQIAEEEAKQNKLKELIRNHLEEDPSFKVDSLDFNEIKNTLGFTKPDVKEVFTYTKEMFFEEKEYSYKEALVDIVRKGETEELLTNAKDLAKVLHKTEQVIQNDLMETYRDQYDRIIKSIDHKGVSENEKTILDRIAKKLGYQPSKVDNDLAGAKSTGEYNQKIKIIFACLAVLLPVVEIFTIKWWSLLAIPATWIALLIIKKKLKKS